MATKRVLVIILRLLLPTVFILSALSKLVAIDQFELYIFSYGLLPLNLCYIAARLCIGAEIVIGVFTLFNLWPRTMRIATLSLLILFSLFLCYALLAGRSDSCQCFGNLADFPPAASLLKNSLLILLFLLYYKLDGTPDSYRLTRVVGSCLVVPLLVLPFLISVPDSWYFRASHEPYDSQALEEALQLQHLERRDAHLVAFVTRGCPYCRMTQQKINSIASRHDIDTTRIRYIEPTDLPGDLFLRVTYGARPLVLLLDADTVVATYHFRNIDEAQIASLLATH